MFKPFDIFSKLNSKWSLFFHKLSEISRCPWKIPENLALILFERDVKLIGFVGMLSYVGSVVK